MSCQLPNQLDQINYVCVCMYVCMHVNVRRSLQELPVFTSKVSDTKANNPGTSLNGASSIFFFLNCLRALQKHICGVASLQQHFALFNYCAPSKVTNVAHATALVFLSPREVGCVTTQCTCCKIILLSVSLVTTVRIMNRRIKSGHLAPQIAGRNYSVSC